MWGRPSGRPHSFHGAALGFAADGPLRRSPPARPALRVRARERQRRAAAGVDLGGGLPLLQEAAARGQGRGHDRDPQLLPDPRGRGLRRRPRRDDAGRAGDHVAAQARHRAARDEGDPHAQPLRPRAGADRVRAARDLRARDRDAGALHGDRAEQARHGAHDRADRRGGRDRAGRALDPHAGPLRTA